MLLIEIVPVEKMAALIELLYQVNNRGYWGITIQSAVRSGNISILTQLINELRDQAKDNREVMTGIIGQDCFNALMAL